ncbi:hypothetical protein M0D21_05340 [Aquimarina sp. D1M17]|uniref:tetratricopeptide repeat-containing sensor histidine kinase n=1 Tax=Aquimarina acroporae TaxID=2937283 RepID=UPI0020BDC9B7|nr:tetratricopeptide repeat-containing sensor histidine kinase [Aquimarina acroporae]MCK8520978.1 hypothetical protein [Aquimarina acroporae]
MKLWRVNFPRLISVWGLISCITISAFGQDKELPKMTQKQLDSILVFYRNSNLDSININERISDVSSFLKFARLHKQDSLVYMGLMRKTKLLGKNKKYTDAIKYSNELYDLAVLNKDTSYIQKALTKLGLYHRQNNQLDEAFKYYNESFIISRKTKDSIKAGRNLLQMANIQYFFEDFSGSKTTAIDGLSYLEKTNDGRSLAGLYHRISVANRKQKNYEEALKYNQKAIEIDTSVRGLHILRNTRANILSDQEKYDEAISIFKELINDTLIKKNREEYARVLGNLGHVEWLKNPQNLNSEPLLLKSKNIREYIKDVRGLIASNIYLTNYYFDKDTIKAIKYAEAAYQNAEKINGLVSMVDALGFLIQLKDDTKEEAKIALKLNDKRQVINQSNREIYAATKYENDKLTTENLVLKAETAKKERQRIIYLFGTIILALIAVIVVYLLRQRHKREIIRDVYNAEARISKKLHDELANDIYNVMVQIQNEQSNQDVLDKLEDIYHSTRDISRENSSFNEGRDFSAELGHMMSSYSGDYTKIIIKDIDEIPWDSVTPEKKIIVYRILQELMINMKKHSEANLVAITFKKGQKNIKITYADNGIGVKKDDIIYSNGLRNAENRIKTIGGSFIFDSEIERGFKATLHFPN